MDEALGTDLQRDCNRLREQLNRFFPELLKLVPGADASWLWLLLSLAPTRTQARKLTRRNVEKLLNKHRVRKYTTDQVIAVLRSESLRLAPGSEEAASHHVRMLLPRIQLTHKQRLECERMMKQLLKELPSDETADGNTSEHRDADIVLSFPGAGTRISATMLSEAATPLREADYHALRRISGTAPVTRRTGYRRGQTTSWPVVMRKACNPRLRRASQLLAEQCVRREPYWKSQLTEATKRNTTRSRALRGIADRLLRVLCGMLRTRTLYDPTRYSIEEEAA